MSERWSPCKRRDFISKLRKLGFADPHPGGKHQFMRMSNYKQSIPGDFEYPVPQLRKLLKQIEEALGKTITREEWNRL